MRCWGTFNIAGNHRNLQINQESQMLFGFADHIVVGNIISLACQEIVQLIVQHWIQRLVVRRGHRCARSLQNSTLNNGLRNGQSLTLGFLPFRSVFVLSDVKAFITVWRRPSQRRRNWARPDRPTNAEQCSHINKSADTRIP